MLFSFKVLPSTLEIVAFAPSYGLFRMQSLAIFVACIAFLVNKNFLKKIVVLPPPSIWFKIVEGGVKLLESHGYW